MILPIIHQRLGDYPKADEITEIQVAELATTTHRFTLLAIAHARDTSPPTHDWDLEGILLVEGPDGLEGMWTQAHWDWRCYAGNERVSQARMALRGIRWAPIRPSRPQVWIEHGGHGIFGHEIGESPTEVYDDYTPSSMFNECGLWTGRMELFVQDEHGRW